MRAIFGKNVKAIIDSATFQQIIAKIKFSILTMFFLAKPPSVKVYKKFLGRRLFSPQ